MPITLDLFAYFTSPNGDITGKAIIYVGNITHAIGNNNLRTFPASAYSFPKAMTHNGSAKIPTNITPNVITGIKIIKIFFTICNKNLKIL